MLHNHGLLFSLAFSFAILTTAAAAFLLVHEQPPPRSSSCHRHNAHVVLPLFAVPPGRVEDIDEWVRLSSKSLKKFTGRSMYDEMGWTEDDPPPPQFVHSNERWAVLSHGTQDDPIYKYFNKAAFLAFGFPEDEVYQTRSRKSAPDGQARKVREVDVQASLTQNVQIIESALRQRYSGELFEIRNIILWNVFDDSGNRVGQTAVYDRDKVVPYSTNKEPTSY